MASKASSSNDFWGTLIRRGSSLSRPLIKLAKAKNICRACRCDITKGNKYMQVLALDRDIHRVRYPTGGYHYTPFHETLKFCKDCSVDLLKICSQNKRLTLPRKYVQKTLLAIHSMFYTRNRFNILTERSDFYDFLKSKGVAINTTCPKCDGQGKVWNPSEYITAPCTFPGCDNGTLIFGTIGNKL